MSTPTGVLIARALHFLELASLQLNNGLAAGAARSIEKAVSYLEGIES